MERLRALATMSRRARWGWTAFAWVIAAVVGLPALRILGADPWVVALLPVGVTALLWGVVGGAIAAVAALPVHIVVGLIGDVPRPELLARWPGLGTGALLAFGIGIGWARSLAVRLVDEFEARRAAYEALDRARRRLADLHENVPAAIYRTSIDGRFIEANPAMASILGYTLDELMDLPVAAIYPRPTDREAALRMFDGRDIVEAELPLRRKDGAIRIVRARSRAVRDEGGRLVAIEGVAEDITEAKRAEEELRRSDERFRAAFVHGPVPMAITGPDGVILKANQAFGDMLGLDPADVAGSSFLSLTHPDDREENRRLLAEMVAGERDTYRMEKRYVRPDGTEIWALLGTAVVRDAEGRMLYQVSTIVDITERRRAASALESLVQAKDEFIASVSHELRTPLTVVHGLASELERSWRSFAPEETDELISMIAGQSRELADLVEDLLVAVRADVGELAVYAEPCDIRSAVEAVLTGLDRRASVAVDGDGVVALADPTRVRQIVRNLVTNAFRYGAPPVTVSIREEDGFARIEVVDGGSPIPEDRREAIFQAYGRAYRRSGQPSSVGLGLTVSRKLARAMGGDVTYRHDGRSVFSVVLPLADVATTEPAPGQRIEAERVEGRG